MISPQTFVGLDVGGTNLKALAFSSKGEVLLERSLPTDDDGTKAWLKRARELVRELAAKCPPASRLGVAAPGLVARDGRTVTCMPDRLAGLVGLDWQEWIGTDAPVAVFNDAKAALLGEVWLGAARGATNVLLLTLGTGVGGAAMVDGRVLNGHIGRAGHLGHVSLNPEGPLDIVNAPGSLEDAIGECSLPVRSKGAFPTTRELVGAYRAKSPEAAKVWLTSIRSLAAAIAGFVNVLDPELVVIGGGMADADDALFQPLSCELNRFEWRPAGAQVRIVKAALGRNAGAAGAAYGAKLAAAKHEPVEVIPSLDA